MMDLSVNDLLYVKIIQLTQRNYKHKRKGGYNSSLFILWKSTTFNLNTKNLYIN